jgi:hypothetical protein
VTRADGKSHINAVEVGELVFHGIGSPTQTLSVKYAYSNAETGDRYGFGTRNTGWSERTLELLDSLLSSVERDVCSAVFEEGPTTSSGADVTATTLDGVSEL